MFWYGSRGEVLIATGLVTVCVAVMRLVLQLDAESALQQTSGSSRRLLKRSFILRDEGEEVGWRRNEEKCLLYKVLLTLW
jgi:hypothetical protein